MMEPSETGEEKLSGSDHVPTIEEFTLTELFVAWLPKYFQCKLDTKYDLPVPRHNPTISLKRNAPVSENDVAPSTSKRCRQNLELFDILKETSVHQFLNDCTNGSQLAKLLREDLESRLEKFSIQHDALPQKQGFKIELAPIQVSSRQMALSNDLKHQSLMEDFALIRNIVDSCGIDKEKFSVDALTSSSNSSSTSIEIRTQKFQPTDVNEDSKGRPTWNFTSVPGEMKLSKYGKYFKGCRDYEDHEEGEIQFGTNLDFLDGDGNWTAQLNELEKLPDWMKHNSQFSYIANKYTQLSVLGVNTVQAYLKVKGSRTPGHHEHGGSTSVNINLGPGISKWYGVRRADSYKLKRLIKTKGLNFSKSPWWPDQKDLIKNKISYFEFDQLPGDAVVVNVGAPHWVESSSRGINVAWNVALFTEYQLEGYMERCQWDQVDKFQTLIPMNTILRNLLGSLDVVGEAEIKFQKLLLINSARVIGRIKVQMDQVALTGVKEWKQISPAADFHPSVCFKCRKEILYHVLYKVNIKRTASQQVFCMECSFKIDKELSTFQYRTDFDLDGFLVSYDKLRESLKVNSVNDDK